MIKEMENLYYVLNYRQFFPEASSKRWRAWRTWATRAMQTSCSSTPALNELYN